jgi:prepilin-type N-terminal cleavage/methylation domain-containing protein
MRSLRQERGFTLIELLVTMVIALTVSFATFSLIEFTMKRTGAVDARVDATQRGRMTMDLITRQLRSQVCVNAATPAMATRTGNITDGNTATFYVDLSNGSTLATTPPELHTLALNTTSHQLVESDYVGSWNAAKTLASYPAGATRTAIMASNVYLDPGTTLFRYYAYDKLSPPTPSIELLPSATGLSVSDLGLVAMITVNFRALPIRATAITDPGSIVMSDQVYVRAANPNDDAPTPTCAT